MRSIPAELLHGPFSRDRACALGVTSRMLQGKRFQRVLPHVWRYAGHEMTQVDWLRAAELVLPKTARLTGITRLQVLGLDFGPELPVRFVVEGDHHLAYDEVFLHRTKTLPPTDDVGVTVEAAFVHHCAEARVIDAIEIGDWLLRNRHTDEASIRSYALSNLWRPGASEAIWILDHLDGRARSLKESETRAVLCFAGLPRPEANVSLPLGDGLEMISDLVYRRWRTVVEYEGAQHQEDRAQYVKDLDRYAIYRRLDIGYVQATKEKLDHAKTLVSEVYNELRRRGYDGPAPEFGERWRLLFARCSHAVGASGSSRARRLARRGPGARSPRDGGPDAAAS